MAKVTAAITPGICLLLYFYLKDKYQPEPIRLVMRMFILGGLIVFPLLVIQAVMNRFLTDSFTQSLIVSGLTEEFAKWFLVYFLVFRHPEFDEQFDGIVYAVATAVGFATVENIFYIFLYQGDLLTYVWQRAFLPVSGHALFGVTMGYYFGKLKQQQNGKYLFLSLFLPVLFHGMFNSIMLMSQALVILPMTFMAFLWFYNIRKMNATLGAHHS